jgi:hypothetical protein
MKLRSRVRCVVSTIAVSLFALPCAAQHVVTHGELPNVSPDGALIAFLSDRTGTNNVFVIGVDGSGERQVSQSGAGPSPRSRSRPGSTSASMSRASPPGST